MYGILSITFDHDRNDFKRRWVKLPEGNVALYETDELAHQMAAKMVTEARLEGIMNQGYRARRYPAF